MIDRPGQVWADRGNTGQVGYYGVPVIHASHWKWLVIWYFFFGGISGSAAVIAAIARLTGGTRTEPLARTATYVAFVALLPCPPLLIFDLGRPQRFLNMLRAFRPSSPMSIGSWALLAFGMISTLCAACQVAADTGGDRNLRSNRLAHRVSVFLAPVSAIAGFFLAGYTGTLLAATAVPLWSRRPALLGPLFLASAMSSGAASVSIAHAVTSSGYGDSDRLHVFEAVAAIAEGTLLAAWLFTLGPTSKPLRRGHIGAVIRHGVVGMGVTAPLAVTAISARLPRRYRQIASIASSMLALCGVFALRYAVVEGGRLSANDPEATFQITHR